MRTLLFSIFLGLLATINLQAQAFVSGTYSHHFLTMPRLNSIMDSFNLRENHQLKHITSLSGFQFTAGAVQELAIIEFGFANSVRRIKSITPNQLRETAEVIASYTAATFHVGVRPFLSQYFFVGIGANFGLNRIRYSFGGDYIQPIQRYNLAPEIFVDYSIKIKFLLKQNLRKQTFYLLRIRPFYQVHFPLNVARMEQSFNENTTVVASNAAYEENWSNFGIRIGLVVPISKIPDYGPIIKAKKIPKMTTEERREKFKMTH
jgi:hypothetical protein